MKTINFIYISPNFPENHWNFVDRLKAKGVNTLGIGDCEYDNLSYDLKNSLNEYYKVSSLENYDDVYKAVAFFAYKYGRIDWIETNNEYWLERDARLRDDFNINTGFHSEDMELVKYKSQMKKNYLKAGIAVARHHIVDNYENCLKYIDEVSYPVVIKPDNGVGASDTHKIKNQDDLKKFFDNKYDIRYIMEEFIAGEVQTYDAIVNKMGEPIFENGNVTVANLMEVVNNKDNSCFYIRSNLPEDLLDAGRRTIKAFNVKSRFVHLEFFRLTKDQHIGKKDDIVALEVNMRPSGGISPTMMNWASDVDVYDIWADMIVNDSTKQVKQKNNVCVFASRRNGKNFKLSAQEVSKKYADRLKHEGNVEQALSGAMADYMYIANFETELQARDFIVDVLKENYNIGEV